MGRVACLGWCVGAFWGHGCATLTSRSHKIYSIVHQNSHEPKADWCLVTLSQSSLTSTTSCLPLRCYLSFHFHSFSRVLRPHPMLIYNQTSLLSTNTPAHVFSSLQSLIAMLWLFPMLWAWYWLPQRKSGRKWRELKDGRVDNKLQMKRRGGKAHRCLLSIPESQSCSRWYVRFVH